MKTTAAIFGALAATFFAGAAFAADSGERTTMPSSCSDRDTNCVIQDGPPRRRGGAATEITPPTGSSSQGSTNPSSKPNPSRPLDTRDSAR
jgi:hypothetical protein